MTFICTPNFFQKKSSRKIIIITSRTIVIWIIPLYFFDPLRVILITVYSPLLTPSETISPFAYTSQNGGNERPVICRGEFTFRLEKIKSRIFSICRGWMGIPICSRSSLSLSSSEVHSFTR